MSPMRLRGKTAPEIYTTVKHLRETEREQRELGGGSRVVAAAAAVVVLQKVNRMKRKRERERDEREEKGR